MSARRQLGVLCALLATSSAYAQEGAPAIVWNADPNSPLRGSRTVTFTTASGGEAAIALTLMDLQNPIPPNAPCCPPPDFSTYESATCTAAGETGGCVRWVGPVQTFMEFTPDPSFGSFRGARLQCTPYYYDWTTEPLVTVFGAELVPSSTYEMQSYGAACEGAETGCTSVSDPVTVLTRRFGDVAATFNPPSTTAQPNAIDCTSVVNKFLNKPGAPSKRVSLIQGQTVDPNYDIDAIDVSTVVNGFRGLRFPYLGPCSCPSSVTCNATACTSPAACVEGEESSINYACVKTCVGGIHADLICRNNGSCPGGTCGTGFCRDRCLRCTP